MSKGATFEATGTLARVCKCCGAADAALKCGLCLTVYYCCKACQEKDWKEGGENRHKVQCKRLVEIKARCIDQAKKGIEEKKEQFGTSNVSLDSMMQEFQRELQVLMMQRGGAGPSRREG